MLQHGLSVSYFIYTLEIYIFNCLFCQELDQSKLKIAQLESCENESGTNSKNSSAILNDQSESIRFLQKELESLKEMRQKEQTLFDSVVKQRDIYKEKIDDFNLVINLMVV